MKKNSIEILSGLASGVAVENFGILAIPENLGILEIPENFEILAIPENLEIEHFFEFEILGILGTELVLETEILAKEKEN